MLEWRISNLALIAMALEDKAGEKIRAGVKASDLTGRRRGNKATNARAEENRC